MLTLKRGSASVSSPFFMVCLSMCVLALDKLVTKCDHASLVAWTFAALGGHSF
jgi:hypothetical protein